MSDEGEKTCPLCAEEMDLTDQQLRPCKCGYDICVWCWHHIMDMAEKDDTEGRCPACRTPYNKEKIVGTASNCERLVAEMSVEKKHKSQKGKSKTSEGRKQLSSVRVIQRNLVYIVGLPLNLADEDLLQRKEYFGQYGKVLKVSISRTATGAIQQFANSTCSVYITYSKEEEAVRSIQSVHGFILEGRPLRACFGTTKYCHAWLRNMPCTNPDCLYLHEFGSQEDSFTKDEIISEYTRGRVQQVTGATNDMQRRSGNILPPAVDDYPNNSASAWGNPIGKVNTNDPTNSNKGSPPNSSTGRSVALPAAASWGTRTSNSLPLAANVVSANGPSKQKADTHTTLSSSTAVVSSSTDNETLKKQSKEIPTADGRSKLVEYPEYAKQVTNTEHMKKSEISSTDKDANVSNEEKVQKLASDMSSLDIDRKSGLQLRDDEKLAEPLATNKSKNTANSTMEQWDLQNIVREIEISEVEADLLSFNDQRLRDPEVVTHTGYVQSMPQSSHFNNSMGSSSRYVSVNGSGLDPPFVDQNLSHGSLLNTLNLPVVNGNISNLHGDFLSEGSNGHSYFPATEGSRKQMGIFDDKGGHSTAMDLGENSIISNILSMDFDPWGDESLTSPQNLAKLLGDGDKQQGSQRVIGSRKTQNCNQSRFSFAREDGCIHHGSNFTSNSSDFGPGLSLRNLSHDFVSNSDVYPGQLSNGNGFSSFSFEESDRTASNLSSLSFNKIPVSRSQISAPPGFLGPNRAPPPGFTSSERIEQAYDSPSGNDMFDTSSLLRKMHQAPAPVYNGSIGDLEFMDPAILAVGGSRVAGGLNTQGSDMRSNYPSQLPSFETDNGLRFLVQRSFKQQNQRFSELGDNYPQQTDNYGIPSRFAEQTLPNNPNNRSLYQQGSFQQPRSSLMSNGHWDSWNEVQSGNDVAMAELLRNERLGFNKYYSGYEDAQFRLPSSGNVYNRTYGI